MKAFTAALESMGKDAFSIGEIPPTPVLVDQYLMIRRESETKVKRMLEGLGIKVETGKS